jgi:histidine triad (HIT) family protein
MECLFCKIVDGKIPAALQYQDDQVIAFKDINPQAPVHTIIIPKKHINTLNDIAAADLPLVSHMIKTATELAKTFELHDNGYRLVFNCNADGGQSVFHIHLHLVGGRQMMWPPG